jgi:ketosteroid isomerase-like protein
MRLPDQCIRRDNRCVAPTNIELARRGSADLQSLFALFDDELVWDNRGTNAPADLAGTYQGKRAATRIIERWVGTWADYEFDIEELIDGGDTVLVGVREIGRGKGSGVPMERRYGMAWGFRDGRIVHVAVYDSLADARRARWPGS